MSLAPLPGSHAIVYFAIKLFDQSVTVAGETLHTPIVKREAFFAVKVADFFAEKRPHCPPAATTAKLHRIQSVDPSKATAFPDRRSQLGGALSPKLLMSDG